jgi:hypothetical protein
MRVEHVLFCLAIIVLFIGCTGIPGGVVIDKRYTPAHTSIRLTPVYIDGTLRTIMMPVYQAESWTITVQVTVKEKEHHRNFEVTQEVFERIKIGDFFSVTDHKPLDTSQRHDGGAA